MYDKRSRTTYLLQSKLIYIPKGNGLRLAVDEILRNGLVKLRSMSSRLLPLVSGTQKMMKKKPIEQMTAKNKNA